MRLQKDEFRRVQYQIYVPNEIGQYEPYKYLGRYPYIVEDHIQIALEEVKSKYQGKLYEVYRVTTEKIV